MSAAQLELFAVAGPVRTGENGWPMCEVCRTCESIGPPKTGELSLCYRCWKPGLDPVGAAVWDRIEAARKPVQTARVTGGVL